MQPEITDELLLLLGFERKGLQGVWTYPPSPAKEEYRIYRSGNQWYFNMDTCSSSLITHPMTMLLCVRNASYQKGIQDTQDKIQEGLGLKRLVEDLVQQLKDRGDT